MDANRLRAIPLFAELSKRELEQLARWTDEVTVPAGQVIEQEGAVAYEFCVIEDGTADVTIAGDRVAGLGPGDFFGEIGLLESQRRTATVTAVEPTRLIVMFGREFRSMEQQMPGVASRVRAAVEERLARGRAEG